MQLSSDLPIGLLFLIGLSLTLYGLISLWRSNMPSRWMRGQVHINDKSMFEKHEFIGIDGVRLVYYCVAVEYVYEYAGAEYIGNSVYIDRGSACFLKMHDSENLLRKLDDVTYVLIHPSKPGRSVLFDGLSGYRRSHFFAILLSGCTLVFIAIYFYWVVT